jgi:hypothetical protein
MRARTVTVITLLAVGTAGLFGAGAVGSTTMSKLRVITERDSARTITLARTGRAELRLDNRWTWSAPRVHGRAAVLVPIDYERNPGYSAWKIQRRGAGSVKITSWGRPNCDGCKRHARWLSVKLKLSR